MLRTGVQGAEVFFARPAGFERLTVGNLVQDAAPQVAYTATLPERTAEVAPAPVADQPAEVSPPVAAEPKPVAPAAPTAADKPAPVKVARKIPMATSAQRPVSRTAAKPTAKPAARTTKSAAKPAVSKSLLSRLFKR